MKDFLSYSDYLNKRKQFVYLEPTLIDRANLEDYSKTNGLENNLDYDGHYSSEDAKHRYHLTLWYSDVGYIPLSVEKINDITLKVKNWAILGRGNPKFLALDLEITEELENLHQSFVKYGLKSDWKNFRPHMTLVNHWKKGIPRIDPPKEITFNTLVVKESF